MTSIVFKKIKFLAYLQAELKKNSIVFKDNQISSSFAKRNIWIVLFVESMKKKKLKKLKKFELYCIVLYCIRLLKVREKNEKKIEMEYNAQHNTNFWIVLCLVLILLYCVV